MMEATTKLEIAVPIHRVAERLFDFGGLHRWYPGLEDFSIEGSGVGSVRSFRVGEQWYRERLEALDDERWGLEYTVIEGPLPVADFSARYWLREENGTTEVVWQAQGRVAMTEIEADLSMAAAMMQQALLALLKVTLEEDLVLVR